MSLIEITGNVIADVKTLVLELYTNLDITLLAIFLTLLIFFYKETLLRPIFKITGLSAKLIGFVAFILIYVIIFPLIMKYLTIFIRSQEPTVTWIIIAILGLLCYHKFSQTF